MGKAPGRQDERQESGVQPIFEGGQGPRLKTLWRYQWSAPEIVHEWFDAELGEAKVNRLASRLSLCSLAADGTVLASDGYTRLRLLSAAGELRTEVIVPPAADIMAFNRICLSPCGTLLGLARRRVVHLWDAEGRPVGQLGDYGTTNRESLAGLDLDAELNLYTATRLPGILRHRHVGPHFESTLKIRFSRDIYEVRFHLPRWAAVRDEAGLSLFELTSARCLWQLPGSGQVRFSPSGAKLVRFDRDGLGLFRVLDGRQEWALPLGGGENFEFFDENRILGTVAGRLHWVDLERSLHGSYERPGSLVAARAGRALLRSGETTCYTVESPNL